MSGIEGNYRITCENVMRVLRSNKDSLMAVLEAFVHDPLVNWWRSPDDSSKKDDDTKDSESGTARSSINNLSLGSEEHGDNHTNPRALAVISRVSNKLTGIFASLSRYFRP